MIGVDPARCSAHHGVAAACGNISNASGVAAGSVESSAGTGTDPSTFRIGSHSTPTIES
jgi:hypothetical protein